MVDDVQAAIRTEGAALTHAFIRSSGELADRQAEYRAHVWVAALGTIYSSLAAVYGAENAEMLWTEAHKMGKEYGTKPPAEE